MGDSQFAPPRTVTTPGLRSLIVRAMAREATFWANMEVKPTRFSRSSWYLDNEPLEEGGVTPEPLPVWASIAPLMAPSVASRRGK